MTSSTSTQKSALILIDGEHYPSVVRTSIQKLSQDVTVTAALLLGGTEKLRENPDYGIPVEKINDNKNVAKIMLDIAKKYEVNLIIDLSDEPVLSSQKRFELINHALAAGYSYQGADFMFHVPTMVTIDCPTLAIVGTNKRVGKTAISNYTARLFNQTKLNKKTILLSMGRGGPTEPEIVDGTKGITLDDLLTRALAGQHAASDFLEVAVFNHITTVGCHRCGGGMAGAPFYSNVAEGAQLAVDQRPDLLIIGGSGACIPPIKANQYILIMSAQTNTEDLLSGLGSYRILLAHMIILTLCELPFVTESKLTELKNTLKKIKDSLIIITTILRPKPIESIANKNVVYFTTAPFSIHQTLANYLTQKYQANIQGVVGSLSNRLKLKEELQRPEVQSADTYLIEIKAAAIDTVAMFARNIHKNVVFCNNEPIALPNELELDQCLLRIVDKALNHK